MLFIERECRELKEVGWRELGTVKKFEWRGEDIDFRFDISGFARGVRGLLFLRRFLILLR